MLSTDIGQKAEQNVAEYLNQRGFKILVRNWRRPRCEVDIVAQKDEVVYFVEVKYRGSDIQGEGFEYVTTKKQKQLLYAANLWCQESNFSGDMRLLAASVSGTDLNKINVVEI